MEERELKALEIAAKSKLTRKGTTWLVPSQSVRGAKYTVNPDPNGPECSCPDFECRKLRCKHIFAVEYTIEREQTADGETVVTESIKVTRRTYSQNWPAYNTAQTQEKSELQALLYELCRSVPEPEQHRGRPRLSLADMMTAATNTGIGTATQCVFHVTVTPGSGGVPETVTDIVVVNNNSSAALTGVNTITASAEVCVRRSPGKKQ